MQTKNNGAFKTEPEEKSTWPSPAPAKASADPPGMDVKTRSLTRTLFALDEPWRSRFLKLVANLATNWTWDGRAPTPEQMSTWLRTDLDLYREVRMLLDAWLRPRR
jgi:hypothetical protein